MRTKHFCLILVFVMLFCMLPITACAPARRPGPVEPAPGTPPMEGNSEPARADAMAEKITQIQNIRAATVVISGNTAWVGVDLNANVQMTDALKDEIANMVKNDDKTIQNVFVTADADTVTRLKNIANELAAGRPVSGFVNELNEISQRINPAPR